MLKRTVVALRVGRTRGTLRPAAVGATKPPPRQSWEDVVSDSFFESNHWTEEDYTGRGAVAHAQMELSILLKAFTEYDLDANGVLDKEEIKAALEGLSLDNSPEAVNKIFLDYDSNGDGVISLEEWLGEASPGFRSAVLSAFKEKLEG